MLPVKKIYTDSTYKISDSISDSDFKIDLPQSLLMLHDAIFYADDIMLPHSFYTINAGVNDTMYVSAELSGVPYNYAVSVAEGMYTGSLLKIELQNGLNMLLAASGNPFALTVEYVYEEHKINISTSTSGLTFLIKTDSETGMALPHSLNDILGNKQTPSPTFSTSHAYKSQYLDLQPIKNIYMSSPNLGTFTTIGPLGESNIIKKIPVTAGNNEMIYDNVSTSGDYLDCSKQLLRRLEFQLKDSSGKYLNLRGQSVSFSVVFAIFKE
jgi:hypothetical protein